MPSIENLREHTISLPKPGKGSAADGYYTLGIRGDKPPLPGEKLEVSEKELESLRKIKAFAQMESDGDIRVVA